MSAGQSEDGGEPSEDPQVTRDCRSPAGDQTFNRVLMSSSGSTRTSRRLFLRRTSSGERIHSPSSHRKLRRRLEQQQQISRRQTVFIGGGGDGRNTRRRTVDWMMLLVPGGFLSWTTVWNCSPQGPGEQRRPLTRTEPDPHSVTSAPSPVWKNVHTEDRDATQQ